MRKLFLCDLIFHLRMLFAINLLRHTGVMVRPDWTIVFVVVFKSVDVSRRFLSSETHALDAQLQFALNNISF